GWLALISSTAFCAMILVGWAGPAIAATRPSAMSVTRLKSFCLAITYSACTGFLKNHRNSEAFWDITAPSALRVATMPISSCDRSFAHVADGAIPSQHAVEAGHGNIPGQFMMGMVAKADDT